MDGMDGWMDISQTTTTTRAPLAVLINNKVRQTKYQVLQTKHQVRNFNQKSMPKKI